MICVALSRSPVLQRRMSSSMVSLLMMRTGCEIVRVMDPSIFLLRLGDASDIVAYVVADQDPTGISICANICCSDTLGDVSMIISSLSVMSVFLIERSLLLTVMGMDDRRMFLCFRLLMMLSSRSGLGAPI